MRMRATALDRAAIKPWNRRPTSTRFCSIALVSPVSRSLIRNQRISASALQLDLAFPRPRTSRAGELTKLTPTDVGFVSFRLVCYRQNLPGWFCWMVRLRYKSKKMRATDAGAPEVFVGFVGYPQDLMAGFCEFLVCFWRKSKRQVG